MQNKRKRFLLFQGDPIELKRFSFLIQGQTDHLKLFSFLSISFLSSVLEYNNH